MVLCLFLAKPWPGQEAAGGARQFYARFSLHWLCFVGKYTGLGSYQCYCKSFCTIGRWIDPSGGMG